LILLNTHFDKRNSAWLARNTSSTLPINLEWADPTFKQCNEAWNKRNRLSDDVKTKKALQPGLQRL